MKFWKWLAWICTAVFLALLVISLLAGLHRTAQPSDQLNDPPPAPVFR